jgi:hypothetical protein
VKIVPFDEVVRYLSILLVGLVVVPTAQSQALEHGTMIILTSTRNGLVVCADRRLHSYIIEQDDDTYSKIRAVGTNGFFVSSGVASRYVRHYFDGRTEVIFDMNDFTQSFFNGNNPSLDNVDWRAFKQLLEVDLTRWTPNLARQDIQGPKSDVPNSSITGDDQRLLFETFFFYLDTTKTLRGVVVSCVYRNSSKRIHFETEVVVNAYKG